MTVQHNTDPAGGQWHLDKRVPVALIVTLALQAALGIWWASDMTRRLGVVEAAVMINSDQRDRLVRVEATVQSIDGRLARMEDR